MILFLIALIPPQEGSEELSPIASLPSSFPFLLKMSNIQLLILVILEFMNILCTCKLGTHHIFYLDTHYTHETLLQSEYLHTHISLVAICKNDSRAHFSVNSGTAVS